MIRGLHIATRQMQAPPLVSPETAKNSDKPPPISSEAVNVLFPSVDPNSKAKRREFSESRGKTASKFAEHHHLQGGSTTDYIEN
ncbi:unnamed protein product [Arabidopsis thaliana]|uniref:Uncharacterized protein n=1 Tax=Arabidopsis thaliana TaxID=3702 RepID=A0A5S9WS23_ARATH|nr:unnamed protein product [Arabidopsis thaliana]